MEKKDSGGWSVDKGEVVYDPAKGANFRMLTEEKNWKDYTVDTVYQQITVPAPTSKFCSINHESPPF